VSAGAPTANRPGTVWSFPRWWSSATPVAEGDRPLVRLITFAAFAGYGVVRWATLMRPAPGWRLAGLVIVAIALAAAGPLLARQSRLLAAGVAFLLLLVCIPIAGLRWHLFTHLRIAVSADRIGTGLQTLPNTLVPYLGTSHDVRLVIVLGAAVLLLDAAAVLAFAPGSFGDGRRAAAALPLTALAVVPSTLIRPELPYLQGLLLFGLLAAFMWAERVRTDAAASAIVIVAVAGLAGAIAAPRVDRGKPWLDYRAWAGTAASTRIDTFDWNQTYGPLRWPKSGHAVLSVHARTADYWKAEDLDTFNGYAWVAGTPAIASVLPQPSASSLARWTQTLQVTILGMQTNDVIAAGYASEPSGIPGGLSEGDDPGTWLAGRALGPGASYEISAYSPHPTAAQLTDAGRHYPARALSNELTLGLPLGERVVTTPPTLLAPRGQSIRVGSTPVTFPVFGSHARATIGSTEVGNSVASVAPRVVETSPPGHTSASAADLIDRSPYGPAYRLARRLAAGARTPYAFVAAVQAYLAHGFTYDQTTPVRRYPLESFLFSTKQGYCQQFSGAMAMLLRMGGIPARVGSGFTSGTYDASDHRWVATDIDAHAWVEAWFPTYGWVRFDPTPVTAPARGGAVAPPILKPVPGQTANASAALRREIGNAAGAGSVAHHASSGGISPWLIVLGAALLAAVLWPAARVLRSSAGGGDLLSELERALARTRRPLEDGVTLAALEQRMHTAPEAAGYVRALRMARYGATGEHPTASQRRALRQELALGLGLSGHIRALWALPPWLPGRHPGHAEPGHGPRPPRP
jgi:protein-glutamine gamma-glutamyltransferase